MSESKLKSPWEMFAEAGGVEGVAMLLQRSRDEVSDRVCKERSEFERKYGMPGLRTVEQSAAFDEFKRRYGLCVREIHTEAEKYEWLAELYAETDGRVVANASISLDVDWDRVRVIARDKCCVK